MSWRWHRQGTASAQWMLAAASGGRGYMTIQAPERTDILSVGGFSDALQRRGGVTVAPTTSLTVPKGEAWTSWPAGQSGPQSRYSGRW